jgi:3-hydroxyacyl-[acyl-carrier-protein] dehydratase
MPRSSYSHSSLAVLEVEEPLELDIGPDAPLAVPLDLDAPLPLPIVIVPDAPTAAALPPHAPPVVVIVAAKTPIALVLGPPAPVTRLLNGELPLPAVLKVTPPVAVVLAPVVPKPSVEGMITPIALVLEPVGPTSLDIRGVLKYLPHRYPMLLVDRIETMVPGQSATGVKCVTINEPYMTGHFPGYPIMPGVLIVDALAQVAGIMLRSSGPVPVASSGYVPDPKVRPGVLASIKSMRFLRQVLPGDQLSLKVRLLRSFGTLHQIAGEASVGGEVAAVGELVLAA